MTWTFHVFLEWQKLQVSEAKIGFSHIKKIKPFILLNEIYVIFNGKINIKCPHNSWTIQNSKAHQDWSIDICKTSSTVMMGSRVNHKISSKSFLTQDKKNILKSCMLNMFSGYQMACKPHVCQQT